MVILLQDPHCHSLDAVGETAGGEGEGEGTDKGRGGRDTSGQVGRAGEDTQGQAASRKPGSSLRSVLTRPLALPKAGGLLLISCRAEEGGGINRPQPRGSSSPSNILPRFLIGPRRGH